MKEYLNIFYNEVVKKYWNDVVNRFSFFNLVFLIVILVLAYFLTAYYTMLIAKAGKVVQIQEEYFEYIIGGSIGIGFFHGLLGRNQKGFLKSLLLSPFLASTLACLTYAVVINSALGLIYLVTFEQEIIKKYPYLDSTTINYTLILVMLWGLAGILRMLRDICFPKKEDKKGHYSSTS